MQSKVHPTYKTKYRVANWLAYNEVRSHASLKGHTPSTFADGHMVARAEPNNVGVVA